MPASLTAKSRLAALKGERFDVVVIGGGIIGAGIARDAAIRGLRVALFEKNDFGSGTTANSTRLIHGGFGLVHFAAGLGIVKPHEHRPGGDRIALLDQDLGHQPAGDRDVHLADAGLHIHVAEGDRVAGGAVLVELED